MFGVGASGDNFLIRDARGWGGIVALKLCRMVGGCHGLLDMKVHSQT